MADNQAPIVAPALQFTKWTAWFSVAVAAIAGILLVAQGAFEATESEGWPESVQVALIGLVGLGCLGAAISAVGDVLARAHATGHVFVDGDGRRPALQEAARSLAHAYRPHGDADRRPALEHAADRLARAYENAHGSKVAQEPGATLIVPPAGMTAAADGLGDDLRVLALKWSPAEDRVHYLLAAQSVKPTWMPETAVEIRDPGEKEQPQLPATTGGQKKRAPGSEKGRGAAN
jgi:hypothetical protein